MGNGRRAPDRAKAVLFDRDGTWEAGIDDGEVFDGGLAGRQSAGQLGTAHAAAATEVARQARIAFDRTAEALGEASPPISPPSSATIDRARARTAGAISRCSPRPAVASFIRRTDVNRRSPGTCSSARSPRAS